MAIHKIELPATWSIVSRDTGVEVTVEKLSTDILAKLVLHGLTQKVGDAAASAMADCGFKGMKFAELDKADQAKVQAAAKASMADVVETLYKGEWSERRAGGESVDPVVRRMHVLFAATLRKGDKDAKAMWESIKDADDRAAQLDALIAAQGDEYATALREIAAEELEAERKAAARTKALSIKLNL